MSEGHSRLGPSNHRWPKCPGSIREESRYEDIAGDAAIDGTGSHLLLELCMNNNMDARLYKNEVIGVGHHDCPRGWLVKNDRIDRVQTALDYIARRVGELKRNHEGCTVTVESECKSNPGGAFGRTDWWGTCDITITAIEGEYVRFIEVADYKDGRGYVSEKNNTQLISYLFGKMRKHVASGPDLVRPFHAVSVDDCRMTIIQPKTQPIIRYQDSVKGDISVDGIIKSAEKMAMMANATDSDLAPLIAGKHCQWCKANPKRGGHCEVESKQSLKVISDMSDKDLDLSNFSEIMGDPKSLSEDQLTKLADAEKGILEVFSKVRSEIEDRVKQGIKVKGYAMVPGRGSRVWNEDEESIYNKLRRRKIKASDIYPKKIVTPAALLKLESLSATKRKEIEDELVSFKMGKSKLSKVDVTKSDESDTVEMFKDIPVKSTEISFF